MEIQFIYGAKAGALSSAIMTEALNAGYKLRMKHPFVSFDVERWEDFLSIVWHAYFKCSHDHRGQEFVRRIPVSVHYNGNTYGTEVWYDIESKGLRYVSLC